MKNIIYIIAFLMMSFQVSKADQGDPIDCNLAIYCVNPSNVFSCGLLGDVEEDNKIEIIRRNTGAIYSTSYNSTTDGIQVHLQVKEGSYFSEKSGLLNSARHSIAMEVANTTFYCKLK
jgi:hypothetical protein